MKHPFAQEVVEKKYAYVLGITMVALQNGKMDTRHQEYLQNLVRDIGLTDKDLDKILEFARQYQAIKDKIVSVLDTPNKKYCFLMELYSMFYHTQKLDARLAKGINQFAELLNITEPEYNLVRQTYMELEHKNKSYFEKINKICEEDKEFLGEEASDYFTAYEIITQQTERILKNGEELYITTACKILGSIKVLKGAKLIFSGAKVEVYAPIQVEGGHLEIRNSFFRSSEKMNHTMFIAKDTIISIENSTFDGHNTTSIWCHIGGELFVENSIFTHTANKSALSLSECPATIKKSHFNICRAEKNSGGAIYTNSNLEVIDCSFEACSAYRGAAIYRSVKSIPWVEENKMKTTHRRNQQDKESKTFKVFSKRINFLPMPKSFNRIPYAVILRHNEFLNCRGYKVGVVCAYKSQVVINEKNTFNQCDIQNIYYYE